MNRLLAVLQITVALALFILALVVLVNGVLVATRPETISVVNSLIGLGVMLVAMTALGTMLLRKGLSGLRASQTATPGESSRDEQDNGA